MLETKEQKQYLATVVVLIFILSAVSFWNKTDFKFKDTTNYSNKDQSVRDAQAYLDYLKTIKTDPAASKQLFQEILTEDEVRNEVELALGVNKPVEKPVIDEARIITTSVSSNNSVSEYLSQTLSKVNDFNTQNAEYNPELFLLSYDDNLQLKTKLEKLLAELYATKVPNEAKQIHKSLLESFVSYNNLVSVAKTYNKNDFTLNDAIWPQVYSSYISANSSAKTYATELNSLVNKYKITSIVVKSSLAQADKGKTFTFVKTAHAFLGIGDFTITVGDIPRIVMDAVKSGIQSAFLEFMSTMLNKLISQIEKNYVIANFLYYSDALVSGQYAQDYLNKYVADPADRSIIKQFIPQFSCGRKPENLEMFFKAKAQTYLSFDPSTVSPNDPDYYTKLARVGNFLASPSGWSLYYQDLATEAQSAAEQAVQNELSSSGLKTPRDISKASISKSINSIISAEKAAFEALLEMGIENAESIISGIVANLTQNLINKFVFSGVTGNQGGSLGVLKEQSLCLDVFQVTPVVGIDDTPYNQPTGVTQEDAQALQCSYSADIDTVCTSSIFRFLSKCSSTSITADLSARCQSIKTSPYVQTLLRACSVTPALSTCKTLNSLID